MKLSEKQRDFSHKVAIFLIWIYSHKDWSVTLGEAWRALEWHKILIRQGKSKILISKHLKRLAIDLNLFIGGEYITEPEQYRPLGEFWEGCLGGRWGGRFGVKPENYEKEVGWDAGHFEY